MGSSFSSNGVEYDCPCRENYEFCTRKVSDQVHEIEILKDEKVITIKQFINLLQDSRKFRSFFVSLLREVPLQSFMIEMVPMHPSNLESLFEFVVINLPAEIMTTEDFDITRIITDPELQERYVFPLIEKEGPLYRCLGSYVKNSSTSHVEELFHKFGALLNHTLDKSSEDEIIWVTSGDLNVSCAHLKLSSDCSHCQYPKYSRGYPSDLLSSE